MSGNGRYGDLLWKVIGYLKELAFGHALIHGREFINESALVLVQNYEKVSSNWTPVVAMPPEGVTKSLNLTILLGNALPGHPKCSPRRLPEMAVDHSVTSVAGLSRDRSSAVNFGQVCRADTSMSRHVGSCCLSTAPDLWWKVRAREGRGLVPGRISWVILALAAWSLPAIRRPHHSRFLRRMRGRLFTWSA